MALSPAMQWALANGMSEADVYKNINDFLATNPTAAQTQAQMSQYGISPQDVAAATGGKSGGLLSGNIMADASWNSTNTALQNALTEATGQQTANYAVGGSTTADTLKQLNTFLAGGGQFDPNATVYLQAGGVDFITGIDKGVVKDNLNQIVKTLGDQGVNVVLTGSPYAKSIDDVINNNFDPKVDQIFKDVAKANSNVALVGTQGEILQNKKLLVDALHTNAEGTAIYNQSVIDALSQFKNEVPSSTPQAIAEVQKTNIVATTPPVITQAAASPVVAQALAVQAPNIQELISSGVLQPNQATLIGDTYYQPIYGSTGSGETFELGPLENVVTYKANENKVGGNVNFYDPTGQYQQTTQQQKVAGSFLEGLAEAFNDPVVQAAVLGLGGGGALGNALGLTGSTAQAVGTGLFKGGTALAGGASLEDALKTGLLSGGLVYGGNALNNYLTTGSTADVGLTERQFAIQDAKQLADQGLSTTQIKDTLSAGGYNDAIIDRAINAITPANVATTPVAVSTPVTDGGAVTITAPTTPSLSNVLNTIAAPVAVSTPVTDAGTVKVTGTTQPQMTEQAIINLVNNQLAANVGTQTTLPTIAEQTITSNRPATTQEIANVIAATVPNVTAAQAQTLAEQVITSGRQVTTQDLVNAVTSTIPTTITQTTPEQIITSNRPITNQEIVDAITSTLPVVTTPTVATSTVPTQTITAPKSVTTQDIVNAITATVPSIVSPTITPTQTITAQTPATVPEVVSAITATLPSITTTQAQDIAQQVITANKPITTQEVINAITATLPTTTAVTTSTTPTQTITAQKPITTQDVVNAIVAATPAIIPTETTTIPTTTITAQKPSSITDIATAATIPLIQPTTPLTVTPVTTPTTTSTTTVDPLKVAQLAVTTAGLLGAGKALSNTGSTTTQYPIVPIPETFLTPTAPAVSTYPQLPAINFGDINLLRGTQWEKFLNPNYGKVPAPVQYSQPSKLSYNDLMGILGSKQGMPPASALSINDVISGIQNQYGQKPVSTMG